MPSRRGKLRGGKLRGGKLLSRRELRYRPAAVTAITAGLAAVGLLLATGGLAVASPRAPQPTVTQVQAKLKQLTTKSDRLDQQLDQVEEELSSARQRLKVVNGESARYQAQFESMRAQVGQIAAQAYEQGSLNSSLALLTSGHPQQILDQSSILLELSSTNDAEMNQFLAAARDLTSTQQAARRTWDAIVQLKKNLSQRKTALTKTISQQKTLLAQLTPPEQGTTGPGSPTPPAPPTGGGYHGPTSTQGEKAVAFAAAQLGCPYLYGGTGPCHPGFDCSGLTMESWAHAGVGIPRTSYEQWDDLTHVSQSDLEPGDILVFDGAGHVGIYVGHGELIDAPQTGEDIEEVPLSGWYEQNLDGAVRP